MRNMPDNPPLRVEQHGPRRQSGRGESRLHPAPLRVPGVAGEGDGLPRQHRADLPRRARPALLHAPLCLGVHGSAQDHQGRGALHPLPRLQGIHPPEGVPAREGRRLRHLPLRPDLRRDVLDGEELRRARAVSGLRGPHPGDCESAAARALAGAPVAPPRAARSAFADGATVDRATPARDGAAPLIQAMSRFLFLNPPLVLEDDFIDYPYFANHGLLACAGLAARAGADVSVHDAFALPASGRHPRARGGWILGVRHDEFLASLPRDRYDVVVIGAPVFLRIEAAHPETRDLIAALRERFPRSVLLLADGYVGGQHYADYDADRVLAEYPELDAILKYPGERHFAQPDYLATLGDARVVLRDANGRGGDPLEPFYFLDGINIGNFDRFLEGCFADGVWQNTFGVGAGTRSFVTSIGCPHRCIFCTSNPGWRRTGRKLYRPIPLG